MTYEEPYDFPAASNDEYGALEAERRSKEFRTKDPFPNVPAALLSSEHFTEYVRVTGMLHPFYPNRDRVKAASYEARPRQFIRWDNDGRRVSTDIKPNEVYELPENSITFVLIESKIRLPEYIALRFNLRIKHVHRGLLLGTGPLVDPGFTGELLIPLHNLTSEKYLISGSDGIIWIEFTKTTHNSSKWPSKGEFFSIESRKTDVPVETYFERANKNNPIQSSIPSAVKEAKDLARNADASAKKAARTNRIFASIGFLAIAGLIITATNLAVSVVRDSAQAAADARRALRENEVLRAEIDASKRLNSELEQRIEVLRERLRAPQAPPGGSAPGAPNTPQQ